MRKSHHVGALVALIVFAPLVAAALLLSPEADAALKNRNANTPAAIEGFRPTLAINIPTITFSGIQVDSNTNGQEGISGYIDIPWLGEYMKGIYSYAVGVAVVLAGVMMVIGGFYYLTAGGDASRVQKGKQRIADAVIGLFLVYAAYTILITVNPQLTTFESLRIKRLRQSPFELIDEALRTTHADTGTESSSSGSTGTPPPYTPPPGAVDAPNSPLPPPSGQNYVQLYASCPLTSLPDKHVVPCHGAWGAGVTCGDESPTGPRGVAFRDGMRALIASEPDMRRKIAMVAEAGVKCFSHYGSCGATATTWARIAGVGPDQLGQNSPSAGQTTLWNHINHETPRAIAQQLLGVACETTCSGSAFATACGARCDPATPAATASECGGHTPCNTVKRDCVTGAAARAAVRAMFEGPGGPAGWPDSWTTGLEIGDHVHIYNGNSSCGSSHAMIFLGWASPGRARTANGQWAGPQWEDTKCFMRSCGNFSIVTRIYKPSSLAH
ncbi:MAG TPA: hypothetical protein VL426_06950 [Candidatus Binatia bacterium]|nr:hypothetical protein [Candidatus Binatia bacterium]